MPQIRMEQIGNFAVSDLQIAASAAISQSKLADQIADPDGWLSKGTINVVDSFEGSSAGYQELGLSTVEGADTALKTNTVYYFMVNGTEYSVDTTGNTEPIAYSDVVILMNAQISVDDLNAVFTGGDFRIHRLTSGFDKNVFINPNCTRHRLFENMAGVAIEDGVKGTGITWDASTEGRIFYAKDTAETWIGTPIGPDYYASLGGGNSGVNEITTINGDQAENGATGTIFRSLYGFQSDASNVFAYLNGSLLQYGELGTADFQIAEGAGLAGEYTDIVLNGVGATAEDKVTIIVYTAAELSVYATKSYVDAKLTGSVELTGNTVVGGNITPTEAALYNIGSLEYTWKNIYLNDSLEFAPIGTGDTSKIYRSVTGEDTQMKFQIGSSANDKMIFEDETNTALLIIDGDGGVTIPGDLVVQGTTIYANETNTTITDADFVIKDTTTPTDGDASYSVERANGNTSLKWNDSIDRWQALYGPTANITSNILTENDLASGLLLDDRYFTSSRLVVAGDAETNGAIKYAGVQNTVAPDGVFYSGIINPDSSTRLNYGGDLYVKALYADDVYVSAASLYINNKKVIEDVADLMTFRGDIDQSIILTTLGTGDMFIDSGDLLQMDAAGDITMTLASTFAGKHITINNESATGMIKFNDSIQTADVILSQTNADGFSTEFGFDQQTDFNWSVRATDTAPITSLMGAINTNRQDLHEYVSLLRTQGSTSIGANLIGTDGISNIIPTSGTLGSNGTLQAMLEGIASNVDRAGDVVLSSSAGTATVFGNTAVVLQGGDVDINSGTGKVITADSDTSITITSPIINLNSITGINFDDSIQTSPVQLSQTNSDGFAIEFGYDQQTSFNWSVRDLGTVAVTSIMGALNTNRQDLHEYVELLSVKGAASGVAAGANMIGTDGISNITPTGGTLGADSGIQAMLEGIASNVDHAGDVTISSSAGTTTVSGDTAVQVQGGSFNLYAWGESYINVEDADLIVSTSGISTPGNIAFTSVGTVGFTAPSDIYFTAPTNTIDGALVVTGNLTVSGTTTTVNSESITMADNILILNSNEAGVPTQNAGIEIERGTSTNYQFLFDEVSDTFEIGMVGSLQAVATRQDTPTSYGVAYWDSSNNRFNTASDIVYNDGSIDITGAGAFNGRLSGNAETATKLETARSITLAGDVTGTATYDGTATTTITTTVDGTLHTHTNAQLPDVAAGSATVGFVAYNGTTKLAGKFDGGAINPISTTRLNYDGYLYATRIYNAVYNDLAEFMPACCPSEPGMVLVQTPTGVSPASKRGDGAVVGVYSDSYGYALGGDEDSEGKVPVGLSGRVWVWVEEPCSIGNLLITSEKAGFGTVKQSAEDGLGKVFAKVMEEKLDSTPQRVEVLILMA